jgi:hypothetical protein
MFWSQVVATIIAGTVQLGVQSWYVSLCILFVANIDCLVLRMFTHIQCVSAVLGINYTSH